MSRLIAIAAATLMLAACDRELHIGCTRSPAKAEGILLPKVSQPSAAEARTIVDRYLTSAVCTGSLPTEFGFHALGFRAGQLSKHYRLAALQDGFGKQPSAQRVLVRNGPELLFCFNQWVIACKPGRACQCPYDDNAPDVSK